MSMCCWVISPFCNFFAVLDVSFAVNSCLNCSFLHLYLQFYYTDVAVTWYRARVSKSTGRPNFIHVGPPAAKIWRLIDFQDGSRGGAVLLPVSYLMTLQSSKSQNLSANQISAIYLNNGWDIATSGFGKQTFPRNLHLILHQAIEFRPNRSTHYGNMTLPVSYLLMSLPSEGQSLSANQISSTYLNSRLRYNYFRFGKTNVHQIGILLPVSISTIWP